MRTFLYFIDEYSSYAREAAGFYGFYNLTEIFSINQVFIFEFFFIVPQVSNTQPLKERKAGQLCKASLLSNDGFELV